MPSFENLVTLQVISIIAFGFADFEGENDEEAACEAYLCCFSYMHTCITIYIYIQIQIYF